MLIDRRHWLALAAAASTAPYLRARTIAPVYPGRDWLTKDPDELGFDPARLREAVAFAQDNDSGWDFARDQVTTFGRTLGPLPNQRAATNGLIIRHGYIAAEFGDTRAVDPVYSIAKSFLSTVCSIAYQKRLITDLDAPVSKLIHDGGYDSARNAKVTWRQHLQQTTEWEGEMFGKDVNFEGQIEFGRSERKPRQLREPGTFWEYNDVRINRFSLSMLRLFGEPLPDVLRRHVMVPIGASNEWSWRGYPNSQVDVRGRLIESVSGGTRWGGGLWISSRDLARFGLLFSRGGSWMGRSIISPQWIRTATTPGPLKPDYGFLWWLNADKKLAPAAPNTAFTAIGAGNNYCWVDAEHDLVVVWRWVKGGSLAPFMEKLMAAIR